MCRKWPELLVKDVVVLPAVPESLPQKAESPLRRPEVPLPDPEFPVVLSKAMQGHKILIIHCIEITPVIYMLFILAPMMVMYLDLFGSQRPYALM